MSFFFLGIFAYLNYLTPCKREHVLDILIEGLKKLEYRGYDSAGLSYLNFPLQVMIVDWILSITIK